MTSYDVTLRNPDRGPDVTIRVPDTETVLDVADAAGLGLPSTAICRTGCCSACAARLIAGDVDQKGQAVFLDDEHIADGYVLLCVAYPRSDCVLVTDREADLFS